MTTAQVGGFSSNGSYAACKVVGSVLLISALALAILGATILGQRNPYTMDRGIAFTAVGGVVSLAILALFCRCCCRYTPTTRWATPTPQWSPQTSCRPSYFNTQSGPSRQYPRPSAPPRSPPPPYFRGQPAHPPTQAHPNYAPRRPTMHTNGSTGGMPTVAPTRGPSIGGMPASTQHRSSIGGMPTVAPTRGPLSGGMPQTLPT